MKRRAVHSKKIKPGKAASQGSPAKIAVAVPPPGKIMIPEQKASKR